MWALYLKMQKVIQMLKLLTGDLTSIGDKVGFIGFKFVGSETASGTYQIDKFICRCRAG